MVWAQERFTPGPAAYCLVEAIEHLFKRPKFMSSSKEPILRMFSLLNDGVEAGSCRTTNTLVSSIPTGTRYAIRE